MQHVDMSVLAEIHGAVGGLQRRGHERTSFRALIEPVECKWPEYIACKRCLSIRILRIERGRARRTGIEERLLDLVLGDQQVRQGWDFEHQHSNPMLAHWSAIGLRRRRG